MEIDKDLKRRLLVAIAVGEIDFNKFPEFAVKKEDLFDNLSVLNDEELVKLHGIIEKLEGHEKDRQDY